jgi:hypothetical protein
MQVGHRDGPLVDGDVSVPLGEVSAPRGGVAVPNTWMSVPERMVTVAGADVSVGGGKKLSRKARRLDPSVFATIGRDHGLWVTIAVAYPALGYISPPPPGS